MVNQSEIPDRMKITVDYLNNLGWQLSWVERDTIWYLNSCNRPIFSCSQWLHIKSFIYSMEISARDIKHHLSHSWSKKIRNRPTYDIAPTTNRILIEVFDELVAITERILEYEVRFTTPGRAPFMYREYRNKTIKPHISHEYDSFAVLYERKISLEKTMAVLVKEDVNRLKESVRQLKPIFSSNHRLPVALAFVTLHLNRGYVSWYQHKGKWSYWAGDQRIFATQDKEDFEAFILGMAYSYANLPDSVLDQYYIEQD